MGFINYCNKNLIIFKFKSYESKCFVSIIFNHVSILLVNLLNKENRLHSIYCYFVVILLFYYFFFTVFAFNFSFRLLFTNIVDFLLNNECFKGNNAQKSFSFYEYKTVSCQKS